MFDTAKLKCDAHFQDWAPIDLLHFTGGEVVPGSTYEIQTIAAGCPLAVPACYSPALVLHTGKWGDIVELFDDPLNPPQPDFKDISSVVDKFMALPTAPIKARAQLQPNCPYPLRAVDFRDISADVDAYVGGLYYLTYPGPCACPSTVTCGGTACANDFDCIAGTSVCVNGFCHDLCHRCTP